MTKKPQVGWEQGTAMEPSDRPIYQTPLVSITLRPQGDRPANGIFHLQSSLFCPIKPQIPPNHRAQSPLLWRDYSPSLF